MAEPDARAIAEAVGVLMREAERLQENSVRVREMGGGSVAALDHHMRSRRLAAVAGMLQAGGGRG